MCKKISKKIMSLVLTASMLLSLPITTKALNYDAQITIQANNIIEQNFMGIGPQWDISETYHYTDTQWQLLYDRMDYMEAPFVRCLINPELYCTSIDEQGNPIYNFETPEMKDFCKILDYCEKNNISVLTGNWRKPDYPGITTIDDSKNPKIISGFLNYLYNTKGYRCIKYYNYTNEPNYSVTDKDQYAAWKRGISNLYNEFEKEGLNSKIKIAGPDSSNADDWVGKTASDLNSSVGIYDFHRYAWDLEVWNNSLQSKIASMRQEINQNDPNGCDKKLFIGEAGLYNGRNSSDQQTRIKDFTYGVNMSDYVAQSMNGGISGIILWMLDDSMHAVWKNGQPVGQKTWGFWDVVNDPEIRPWFYPMSLFTKYFKAGSNIVKTSDSGIKYLKSAAAIIPEGNKNNVSVAIVNNDNKSRKVKVVLPGATGNVTLSEYRYFEGDRITNEQGFPVPSKKIENANLSDGVLVDLPSRGMIMLTTCDDNTTVSFTNSIESIEQNFTFKDSLDNFEQVLEHTDGWVIDNTNADSFGGDYARVKRDVDTPQSLVYKVDGISDFAIRAYYNNGIEGKIEVLGSKNSENWSPINYYKDTPFTTAGGWSATVLRPESELLENYNYLKIIVKNYSQAYTPQIGFVAIDNRRTFTDTFENFNKAESYTSGLVIDTSNPHYFGNDSSRIKRLNDTEESVIYNMNDMKEFYLRAYYENSSTGNEIEFFTSDNGTNWSNIPMRFTDIKTSGNWYERYYTVHNELAPNTNYLKLVIKNNAKAYTPQIGILTIK